MADSRTARIMSRAEMYAKGEIDLDAFVFLESLEEIELEEDDTAAEELAEVPTKAVSKPSAKTPTDNAKFNKLVNNWKSMKLTEQNAIYEQDAELYNAVVEATRTTT